MHNIIFPLTAGPVNNHIVLLLFCYVIHAYNMLILGEVVQVLVYLVLVSRQHIYKKHSARQKQKLPESKTTITAEKSDQSTVNIESDSRPRGEGK